MTRLTLHSSQLEELGLNPGLWCLRLGVHLHLTTSPPFLPSLRPSLLETLSIYYVSDNTVQGPTDVKLTKKVLDLRKIIVRQGSQTCQSANYDPT